MDQSREERHAEAEADGRVLNSVLRLRILRLCLDEPLTNKEVADRLGKDPATVYHHVRRLAERGFLVAQPERTGARGAREVPYLATRKSWHTPLPDGGSRLLVETFLAELAEADPRTVSTVRLGLRLTPAARDELLSRLQAVFQEYADRRPDPDGTPWSVFLAVHEDTQRKDPG